MFLKLKNLYNQLKLYSAKFSRRRIYIVPSITGILLFFLVTATYLLSFSDQNPWLMSLAFSGFAWHLIASFLTQRMLSQLDISQDGTIKNNGSDNKNGIRIDGVEIEGIPAFGSVKVKINPNQKRFRVSTFSPTGFYYAWTFQKTKQSVTSDLGESVAWRRGSPMSRIDWKLWYRRGRFLATAYDPNFRMRPIEESGLEATQFQLRKSQSKIEDASLWAFLWSFIIVFSLGLLGLRFAPLWMGVISLSWLILMLPGFFVSEKIRYWGRINFFTSWFSFVLVLVAAKSFLEPWMISTSAVAILFIPFTLHMKILDTDHLLQRLKGLLAIALFTVVVLVTAQKFIAERIQSRRFYYYGSGRGNEINWGPSLSSGTLKSADRFLTSGQGIFWVNFSKEDQLKYIKKLPYWRENTYSESRNGLDWSNKIPAADSGIPLKVNLFLPGRDDLQLTREVPIGSTPQITSYDPPLKKIYYVNSLRAVKLSEMLRLDSRFPLESAQKIIDWMKSNNFRYSLKPGRMSDIEEFLFDRKKGLCQHYAGAVAFLLRAAHIPARVVAGYQGGEIDSEDETLLMRDMDAHAWVEVWNAKDKAWYLIDPTAMLFPNEYRLENGKAWLSFLTKFIVKIQNKWLKLQTNVSWIAICFMGLLAFLLAIAFLKREKKNVFEKESLRSIPEVQEWELKMQKTFKNKRSFHEGLLDYFNRVSIVRKSDEEVEALRTELDSLLKRIYAD